MSFKPKSICIVYGPINLKEKKEVITKLAESMTVEWIVSGDTVDEVSTQLAKVPRNTVLKHGIIIFLFGIKKLRIKKKDMNDVVERFQESMNIIFDEYPENSNPKISLVLDSKVTSCHTVCMWNKKIDLESFLKWSQIIWETFYDCLRV